MAFGLGERWLFLVLNRRSEDGSHVQILARGNFSLGSGGLVNFLLALAAVTLGLAGLLAWQGFWPILVIAVVQLVLVSLALIRAWKLSWVQEHIEIGATAITVRHQRHKRVRKCQLDPAWSVVEVRQPEVAWYGPRVFLRSGRRAVELGTFLTSDEKWQLVECMSKAIEKHSALKGVTKF